jgi:hypothetical protein
LGHFALSVSFGAEKGIGWALKNYAEYVPCISVLQSCFSILNTDENHQQSFSEKLVMSEVGKLVIGPVILSLPVAHCRSVGHVSLRAGSIWPLLTRFVLSSAIRETFSLMVAVAGGRNELMSNPHSWCKNIDSVPSLHR